MIFLEPIWLASFFRWDGRERDDTPIIVADGNMIPKLERWCPEPMIRKKRKQRRFSIAAMYPPESILSTSVKSSCINRNKKENVRRIPHSKLALLSRAKPFAPLPMGNIVRRSVVEPSKYGHYSSKVTSSVISVLNSLETGQPALATLASFSSVSRSAPGTFACKVK